VQLHCRIDRRFFSPVYYLIHCIICVVNKIGKNPKNPLPGRSGPSANKRKSSSDSEALPPFPHLSDHTEVTAALDHAFDGTALFVVLTMYRAFSVLDRDQIEELAKLDLTPLQFNILATLQRVHSATTIGALSTMLFVRSNNMSGNVNSLVAKGLIQRQLNPLDSRSFLIDLTPQGHTFLNQHLPENWRRLELLMGELNGRQRVQLIALLKRVIHSIQCANHLRQAVED